MKPLLQTVWQGMDLLVNADGAEIDRIAADSIGRVVLVHRGAGDTPGDLSFAIIETGDDAVVLPASSGIAGRVHFERQTFWSERRCIYWVNEGKATLPRRLRPGLWFFGGKRPGYMRVPRLEVSGAIDKWPLEGPQTWEERKWDRIQKSRLLAPLDQAPRRGRSSGGPSAH